MSDMSTDASAPALQVTLSFAPTDPDAVDPAVVSGTASKTADALRAEGYDPRPVYTQERGGTVYEIALEVAKTLNENKDLIIALAALATPIVTHLLKKREERAARGRGEPEAPTVIIQVNDYSRRVVVDNSLSDKQALERMLLEDKALDVAWMPQNQVNITVEVPSPSRRRSS